MSDFPCWWGRNQALKMKFWVSEKIESVSFQCQSSNNNQKWKNSIAFQGNSPGPNDHPRTLFLLARRITSTSSQEWGSKRASIPGWSLQQQLKNWSKTNTWARTYMQWIEKAWWEMHIRFVVLTPFILLCRLCFLSSTNIFPNQIKQQSSKQT